MPPGEAGPVNGLVIGPGCRVRLHLAIRLADGTEALSSFDGEPIELRLGDGTLAPGLESMLLGLAVGTDMQMLAAGAAVFGAHDPALIQWIDAQDLPAGFVAARGQVVSFTTPGGQETAGTVVEQTATGLRVDLNHPLTAHALTIRVVILAVEAG